ncbi:MAG TPA: hypothetical protein VHF47_04900 [Acidimicrobiales bacterium]|nr:hypothetical protein [Acidimicrobiales bacterium]
MDSRRLLVPAIVVLFVLGLVGLVATRDDDEGDQQLTVGSGGSTTTVEETTTTTAAPLTNTAATVATTATTPPPAPTTSTTARPTTTTTAAAARTWSISPTSGPANSEFTASGSGCTGQGAGVGITLYDPSGQPYSGTGAAAMPDGTWRVPVNIGAVPPGRYTVRAACQGSSPFQYPQARIFTVTG